MHDLLWNYLWNWIKPLLHIFCLFVFDTWLIYYKKKLLKTQHVFLIHYLNIFKQNPFPWNQHQLSTASLIVSHCAGLTKAALSFWYQWNLITAHTISLSVCGPRLWLSGETFVPKTNACETCPCMSSLNINKCKSPSRWWWTVELECDPCVAQHHSTLNRAAGARASAALLHPPPPPPPATVNRAVSVLVSWVLRCGLRWRSGTEMHAFGKTCSCPTLSPGRAEPRLH